MRGGDAGQVSTDWLDTFADPTLAGLVDEAIAGNYSLAQEEARLVEAAQAVSIARADRLPSLDVSVPPNAALGADTGGILEGPACGAEQLSYRAMVHRAAACCRRRVRCSSRMVAENAPASSYGRRH